MRVPYSLCNPMLSIHTLPTTVLALAAACCAFSATPETAPNVAYTASGTFVGPIHGEDRLQLGGEPFSILILANEDLKPTRHNNTSAEYENVRMSGSISLADFEFPFPIVVHANLLLELGAPGSPDTMTISFPLEIIGIELQFSAKASQPVGTITSAAIAPFTAPVALTMTNATLRYADSTKSTTLGVDGTLNAAIQAPSPIDVLYSFTGTEANGDTAGPVSALTEDKNGAFYGTTYYGGIRYGTVFKLTPPAAPGGSWTETTLYAFDPAAGDGDYPSSGVVIAADGTLYGTTSNAGNGGTIFSLTPPSPPATTWTENVLYRFTGGSDGSAPNGLVMQGGTLYGTAAYGGTNACPYSIGCGTAFELAPRVGDWQFSVLHSFTGGNGDGDSSFAGLTPGPAGSFYGTTTAGGMMNNGIVFQLSPPATPGAPWTETVLYDFGAPPDGSAPTGTLIAGPTGEFYGTTADGGSGSACHYGCGTVFEMVPHADNTWTESILYSFQNTPRDGYVPTGGVIRAKDGSLFGIALGGSFAAGSVFKLTPPSSAGASWGFTEASFNVFDGAVYPGPAYGGLTFDASGAILGTTQTGGSGCLLIGCGTIVRLKP